MWNILWPIMLVVLSNVMYNIVAKSTPAQVNPFLSLCITYIAAAVLTLILFFSTCGHVGIAKSLKELNWTSYLLSFAIVGLEVGYIYLYRAGWNVSTGSLVANIALAAILVIVGILFYKETLGVKQIAGIVLCMSGLLLITAK